MQCIVNSQILPGSIDSVVTGYAATEQDFAVSTVLWSNHFFFSRVSTLYTASIERIKTKYVYTHRMEDLINRDVIQVFKHLR